VCTIQSFFCQGDIIGISSGTHCKEKPPLADVIFYASDYSLFFFVYRDKSQAGGQGFKLFVLLNVPGSPVVIAVEFSILTGKVFMMKMKPINVI
jgi:hypothetical protein